MTTRQVLGVLSVILFLVACSSAPQHYECSREAERAIKRELTFPSTYDEHEMATASWGHNRAVIRGDEDNGWWISNATIFGAKNAFGVQTDYIAYYDGWTDTNGDCAKVRLTEFALYTR